VSPLATRCPYCNTSLKVPESKSGEVLKCKCPKCEKAFEVTLPPSETPARAEQPTEPSAPVLVPNPPPSAKPAARGQVAKWLMGCGVFLLLGALASVSCIGIGAIWYLASKNNPDPKLAELKKNEDQAETEEIPVDENQPPKTLKTNYPNIATAG
jgi:hypothetical protein